MYIPRSLENAVKSAEKSFPVIVITGPRQSGKSTLLKHYLKKEASYISLDDPNFRKLLADNPLDYLSNLKKPVIIDEIQYLPELTSFIKILVDQKRSPGSWYITGSQQFPLMKNISETLAGRAAVLSLPTFSVSERGKNNDLNSCLMSSSYPELYTNKNINSGMWYSSYLQTYLERDVRMIMDIGNLRDFEQFIRILAGRTGCELSLSALSRDLGVSVPTIKRWTSVLEASYIIFLIPPYYKNFGKRIIKSPKLYFYDLGLVNYLIGNKDIDLLINSPMAGAIFETFVISEIIKKKYALGIKPEMYFWRSQSGIEIDLITDIDGVLSPVEIKLSSSIKPQFYKNLEYFIELDKTKNVKGYLITNCKEDIPLPKKIKNFYWSDFF
ncbi:MAG: hypothetical protein A2096_02840 [Spirochaetes bacterium GWF1_41_5]|nr:MAG: hypothetical protein A2096_02840 [Spirochaetes bacterium GWF1_41_5]